MKLETHSTLTNLITTQEHHQSQNLTHIVIVNITVFKNWFDTQSFCTNTFPSICQLCSLASNLPNELFLTVSTRLVAGRPSGLDVAAGTIYNWAQQWNYPPQHWGYQCRGATTFEPKCTMLMMLPPQPLLSWCLAVAWMLLWCERPSGLSIWICVEKDDVEAFEADRN